MNDREVMEMLIELGENCVPVNLLSLLNTIEAEEKTIKNLFKEEYIVLIRSKTNMRALRIDTKKYSIYVVNYKDNYNKKIKPNDEVVIVSVTYYESIYSYLKFANIRYTDHYIEKYTMTVDKKIEGRNENSQIIDIQIII